MPDPSAKDARKEGNIMGALIRAGFIWLLWGAVIYSVLYVLVGSLAGALA